MMEERKGMSKLSQDGEGEGEERIRVELNQTQVNPLFLLFI